MLKIDPEREPSEPKDAATVLLLRDMDGDAEGIEVFMVKRHQKSRFMGGAYVFPGGKLDEQDRSPELLRQIPDLRAEEAAARLGEADPSRALGLHVAALRETLEEAGVLLATEASQEAREGLRRGLADGSTLASLVRASAVSLCPSALLPFARWITPAVEPRRFDARFFLARAPADQVARHDTIETIEGAWMSPTEALRREEAGEIMLPPPTLHSLLRLEAFSRAAEALEAARALGPPPVICPLFRELEEGWTLALPGDPEHPIAEPAYPGATRFVLEGSRWVPRRAGEGR